MAGLLPATRPRPARRRGRATRPPPSPRSCSPPTSPLSPRRLSRRPRTASSWACRLIIERLIGPAREAPEQTFLSLDYSAPTTPEEARASILVLGERAARGEISTQAYDVLIGNLRAYLSDRAVEQEQKLTALENHIRYGGEPPWASTSGLSN